LKKINEKKGESWKKRWKSAIKKTKKWKKKEEYTVD
jgi:hypothetical protein